MNRTHALIALALLVVSTGSHPRAGLAQERPAPAPPAYVVIVHPRNPAGRVGRKFMLNAFLKRTTRWPDGTTIRPVDLKLDSATRRRFSSEVLGRPTSAVKAYWQQAIFSGRDVPPLVIERDEDVVAFVLKHVGAVGYVSGKTNVGAARVVAVP